MTEELLKVSDVAKMFSVQDATVREWLKSGELKGVKIGGGHYWRIPKSEAVAMATNRHGDSND